MGTTIYIGNLNSRVTETDLEDEFKKFGDVRNIWIARQPPGFAFVVMEDNRHAADAIRKLDGLRGWKVEISRRDLTRKAERGGRFSRGARDANFRCYKCGEPGHLARDCGTRRFRKMNRFQRNWMGHAQHRGRSLDRSRSRSRSRSKDQSRRERSSTPSDSRISGREDDYTVGEFSTQGRNASKRVKSRERSRERSRSLSPLKTEMIVSEMIQHAETGPGEKKSDTILNGSGNDTDEQNQSMQEKE